MTRSSGFLTCPDQNGATLFQTGLGLVLSKINPFDPPRIVLFLIPLQYTLITVSSVSIWSWADSSPSVLPSGVDTDFPMKNSP